MTKKKTNPLEFFRKAGEDRMKKMRSGGQKFMIPKHQIPPGEVGEDDVLPGNLSQNFMNQPGTKTKPVNFNVGIGKFNVGYKGTDEGGKLTNSNISVEGKSAVGKRGTLSGGTSWDTTTGNVSARLAYERRLGKKGEGPVLKVSGSYGRKKGGSTKSKYRKK